MEMNKQTSVAEISAQLEAHEAFLKTPEGQEWKAINEKIVDYASLVPPVEPSAQTKALFEQMREFGSSLPPLISTGFRSISDLIPKEGFKRGELVPLFAFLPPVERKSNLVFNMVLERMAKDPTYKPVFRFSLEQSLEYFDEDRFKQSVEATGLTYTNPSEKEKKQ